MAGTSPAMTNAIFRLNARVAQRQFQPHLAQGQILGIDGDVEAELAAHLEHALVGREHVAMQIAQALALGIANEMLHQRPADAGPLQIAAHDHGIFGAHIVRVGREPRHAEQLALVLAERDEGHGAGIVDLREAGDRTCGRTPCAGRGSGSGCPPA